MSTWQEQNKNTGTFLTVNKEDSEMAEYDYVVDPKTGGRFHKQSRRNLQTSSSGSQANLETASSAIGILCILEALTTGESFLRFRLHGDNLQPTDGRCEQYNTQYSTYRVAKHDHISLREHAWLKLKYCTSVSKTTVIHVSSLAFCVN